MKRKIHLYLCLISWAASLVAILASLFFFYNTFLTQIQKDLKSDAKMLAVVDLTNMDWDELAKQNPETRVTVINKEGNILYDTVKNPERMENHQSRPEILKAFENGEGQDIRKSETNQTDTIYYASQLKDGNVLRLGREMRGVWVLFLQVLPSMLLLAVLLFIASHFLAKKLTKRFLIPIEEMGKNMEKAVISPAYEELLPFTTELEEKNKDIQKNIKYLEEQKEQLHFITENMNEGMLVVDSNKNLILANQSAFHLLGENYFSYKHKNFLYLSRNLELDTCIQAAIQGKHKNLETQIEEKSLQILASPVYDNEKLIAVICFLLDNTEKKKAEHIRKDFTANVSHELKTPLTSICGYAELLASGMVEEEDKAKFAGIIEKESKRLLDLITDILKLSELDDTELKKEESVCELPIMIQKIVEELEVAAKEKEIQTQMQLEDCKIFANPEMLEQLIRNLYDNAIRYNKERGKIFISLSQKKDSILFSVKDTGIGIPKEHQERVFERFYSVDKSRSKLRGGTGLGLAIVKHIAEQYRAKIEIKSEYGEGTEISVLFPTQS